MKSDTLEKLVDVIEQAVISVIGTRDEDPNAEIIKELIAKLEVEEKPMKVDVEGDKVTVQHGGSTVTTTSK